MEPGVIKVMKFGGAALRDGPGVSRVVEIVMEHGGENPVVVVSALEGVTDLLVDAARAAARGDVKTDTIRVRHRSVLAQLGADPELLDKYNRELSLILESIRRQRQLGAVELDHVLSFGERASARIVAKCFESQGVMATPVDSYDLGLTTDSNHGNARPLSGETASLGRSIWEIPGVPVVTGFLAKDGEGNLTTLGRNGSDLSAALLAEAIEAEAVEFWKNVPGVLSADPASVPTARRIERLCFADAEELGHLGARILHPAAIAPAVRAGIEVRVRFINEPTLSGTTLIAESSGIGPVALVATIHKARHAVALVGTHSLEAEALAQRALESEGVSVNWTGASSSGRARYLGVDGPDVLCALLCVHRALFESTEDRNDTP
jgi:aspartate kinase